MANPNPKIEQLALGRGKRPKLDRETVSMRLDPKVRDKLNQEATRYNCLYGGKPQIAGLLSKIGNGELMIVPSPPPIKETAASNSSDSVRKKVRAKIANRGKNRSAAKSSTST